MLKALLLLALAALCMGSPSKTSGKTADMDFLHKQKKIYELLFFVKQNTLTDAEFYDVGRNYDIETNIDLYTDKFVVQEFLYLYKQGMLNRNAVFSPYYEEHREEMKILFKLFYYAKDFQTFYKTAAWARLYINDGVFTSAFTVAVFYRPDCKYLRLPAPYETYPNLFFDNEVIQQSHDIKMTRGLGSANIDNVDSYMIYANYSGKMVRPYFDDEYKLDYWMEDPSLNAFYYYIREVMPFWLDMKDMKDLDISKDFRGQFYFFQHNQLLLRYYLERWSNDLFSIEDFDWNKPFYPGYYSTLMYNNGILMPQRSRYTNVPFYKYKYLQEIETLELRIMNAIDLGYVYDQNGKQVNIYTPDGLNILANLIEGNMDSCNLRFYGKYDALARNILSFNFEYKDKNKMIPGALQSYSTSMRDPGFYRMLKRIFKKFFLRYKQYMPYYDQNELIFPGIKFESASMDKLVTYFDNCDTFINNAISVENFKDGMKMRIKARRYCLNYKPFTYRFNINSDKETKAIFKIFLGPSFDDVNSNDMLRYLRDYYKFFVEMDKFTVTLRQGSNTIERRSCDSAYTMPDMMSCDMFWTKLEKAVGGSEPFTYYEKLFNYPDRLTLPKGKPEGMRYKMFFYLSPFDETKMSYVELPIFGKIMLDGKPFGFPLDRPMYMWKSSMPNMMMKDVYIYHTTEFEKANF